MLETEGNSENTFMFTSLITRCFAWMSKPYWRNFISKPFQLSSAFNYLESMLHTKQSHSEASTLNLQRALQWSITINHSSVSIIISGISQCHEDERCNSETLWLIISFSAFRIVQKKFFLNIWSNSYRWDDETMMNLLFPNPSQTNRTN